MKKIVIYYSYGGNTEGIAADISKKIGADIARIDTVVPYSDDYDFVVEQGHREVNRGYKPEIKPIGVDLADYDTVILGTPVWWYTFAPAVKTFLEGSDLGGKKIYTFATNGGWLGHTFADVKKACPDSSVMAGIDIRFDGHTLRTSQSEIDRWADGIE